MLLLLFGSVIVYLSRKYHACGYVDFIKFIESYITSNFKAICLKKNRADWTMLLSTATTVT